MRGWAAKPWRRPCPLAACVLLLLARASSAGASELYLLPIAHVAGGLGPGAPAGFRAGLVPDGRDAQVQLTLGLGLL